MESMVQCKGCGKEYHSKEAKCPHCGLKSKRPLYRSWVFWLVLIAILVIGLLKFVFLSGFVK